MGRLTAIALLFATACQDPQPQEPANARAASSTRPAATASATRPAPELSAGLPTADGSAAPPASSTSGPTATPRCPDAGAPKERAISFSYQQVFVPTAGMQRGTTFSVSFRGRGVPVPPANEIYPWCSVEGTDAPATFRLTCEKRKEPLCTVHLREASVVFECGSARREIDVPCGERATLRPGRAVGGVSYH